ncbi:hypothetical protein B0H13DRAFT_2560917, partial [Mycena leptocephala]
LLDNSGRGRSTRTHRDPFNYCINTRLDPKLHTANTSLVLTMRYTSYLSLALAALMQATIAAAAPSPATPVCPGPPAVLRALQPDICAGKACSATVACCTCFFCIEGVSLLVNVMGNQKADETQPWLLICGFGNTLIISVEHEDIPMKRKRQKIDALGILVLVLVRAKGTAVTADTAELPSIRQSPVTKRVDGGELWSVSRVTAAVYEHVGVSRWS